MSATLKPEDILTPEELAARLKVRKTWVYEQTRSRNQNPPSTPQHGTLSSIRLGKGRGVAYPRAE
jgi:hypothetical protein